MHPTGEGDKFMRRSLSRSSETDPLYRKEMASNYRLRSDAELDLPVDHRSAELSDLDPINASGPETPILSRSAVLQPEEPSFSAFGVRIPYKYGSLVLLTFQTSLIVLYMKYSRGAVTYLATAAVVMAELLKIVLASMLAMHELKSGSIDLLVRKIFTEQPGEFIKVGVVSFLYVIQNNLLYIAVSNLEPATYQVTYQLKILTTAVMSVWMLSKPLSGRQWGSLVLLTAGVALVQTATMNSNAQAADGARPMLGLIAVLVSCGSSAFAGVYLEKLLKNSTATVWVRNVQLGVWGAPLGLVFALFNDYDSIVEKGFFQGFGWVVGLLVFQQAAGGLLIAVAIRYADNILKGFATSISIILSSIVSMIMFSFEPNLLWLGGAALVIVATILYSMPASAAPAPTVVSEARR
eukprot:TRINITY_DN4854_c0_g1_i1.p1 TRINITY_DN4854_c0_g1~~TRINITY_DN4854_c0_g1_i1.p1  ORF type:complete len:408 (-),score=128.58 TRINITY_DN4854_c0_g1_i1:299-1522(-)